MGFIIWIGMSIYWMCQHQLWPWTISWNTLPQAKQKIYSKFTLPTSKVLLLAHCIKSLSLWIS